MRCQNCQHLSDDGQRYCDAVTPGYRAWLYRDGRPIEMHDCIAFQPKLDLLRQWREENRQHLEDNGCIYDLNEILGDPR